MIIKYENGFLTMEYEGGPGERKILRQIFDAVPHSEVQYGSMSVDNKLVRITIPLKANEVLANGS